MIVRLYDLPPLEPALAALATAGDSEPCVVRRAESSDKAALMHWIDRYFKPWRAEVAIGLAAQPSTCFIALEGDGILGFAVFDATRRNYFGPTGVAPHYRGKGIGRALLLSALHAQREQGYAYAIIGGVGPQAYYEKAVDAQVIAGSEPGIYVEGWRPGIGSPPSDSPV